MKRTRKHKLDKGMRGWIVNFAVKNHWRVAAWMDVEDLVQEGYLCYAKCLDRYGTDLVQRHFMALVQQSFQNRVHNLAAKRTRTIDAPVASYDAGDVSEVCEGVEPEEGTLATLVRSLPRELSELLQTLLGDARELAEQLPRETTNAWLCRIAGLPAARYDVEAALRRHLDLEESVPVPAGARPLFYVEGRLFER